MNCKALLVLATAGVLLSGTTSAQQAADILKPDLGNKLASCPVCGMDVFEKMLTRVDVKAGDNVLHACALGCASAILVQHKDAYVEVVDYPTGAMIPAGSAYVVFGSRVVPVRAMLPALAFKEKAEAEHFQHIQGGTVMKGMDAFDVAAKIRAERMNGKNK